MTQAVDALRKLPQTQQDDVARFLFELTSDTPMTAVDAAAIAESEDELSRGERITPAAIRAFWNHTRIERLVRSSATQVLGDAAS
jgi:hypothetical protein